MYKEGNYTEYKCAICGQEPIWNGRELVLTLDHINGINNDDRLDNLRWLCPNCDRQTQTFGGKNIKRKEPAKTLAIVYTVKNQYRITQQCAKIA